MVSFSPNLRVQQQRIAELRKKLADTRHDHLQMLPTDNSLGERSTAPPANTSSTCPECGDLSPQNSLTQKLFCGRVCSYKGSADVVIVAVGGVLSAFHRMPQPLRRDRRRHPQLSEGGLSGPKKIF